VTAPLVSVLMPVFNRAAWVGRSIESVLAQTHPAIELIVVDDGSADATPSVLRGFADGIIVLTQDNLGPYAARNLGLGRARGQFIAFADSDDIWHPDKIARQLPLFADPAVGLVFADAAVVEGGPVAFRPMGRTVFGNTAPARGRVQEAFVRGNFVPTCTVVARRTCLEEIGGFDAESRLSADYLAWFRIARRHAFDYVDAPLADYSVHSGGISYDLGRALAARIGLFEKELGRCQGKEEAALVRRILFTLGLHLLLAAVRGRARSVDRPLARAREAMRAADPRGALRALGAFTLRNARLRTRRWLR
jgi:glycosyltransferase involved in cell wall biosynthesis